jgi:hypothetical protein
VVHDGPPQSLTNEILSRIYGEEDWETTVEALRGGSGPRGSLLDPDRIAGER